MIITRRGECVGRLGFANGSVGLAILKGITGAPAGYSSVCTSCEISDDIRRGISSNQETLMVWKIICFPFLTLVMVKMHGLP